jgi:hypothetical protein
MPSSITKVHVSWRKIGRDFRLSIPVEQLESEAAHRLVIPFESLEGVAYAIYRQAGRYVEFTLTLKDARANNRPFIGRLLDDCAGLLGVRPDVLIFSNPLEVNWGEPLTVDRTTWLNYRP